jgi:CelD/BcsL family acetyltransferase involved in cellulose biosynthesis
MEGDFSPYIPVKQGWEEYFGGRSKNFRHKLKRLANMFQRTGDFEVVRYTREDIPRAMQEVLEISRKTWKFRTGTAIASDPRHVRFYTLLAEAAAIQGYLNLWVLRLRKKAIAFAFNLVGRDKVFALKIGFDEDYDAFSPSEFLNQHAIRDCFERQCREYDWLGQILPFKMKWTAEYREQVKFLFFSRSLYGRALYLMESVLVPGMKKMFRKKSAPVPAAPLP